jgi:hypothetical protein
MTKTQLAPYLFSGLTSKPVHRVVCIGSKSTMNLKKLLFWQPEANPSNSQEKGLASTPSIHSEDALSNVIQLPISSPISNPAGLAGSTRRDNDIHQESKQTGLMDLPEIQKFFCQNHFGLGKHNGANFKTQAALDLGKRSIICQFQNVLSELYERKKTKEQKLHIMALQTNGYCDVTSSMIEFAKTNVQRDMNILEGQISEADKGKGWILQALNEYQIGFGKGLNEAVEFELERI